MSITLIVVEVLLFFPLTFLLYTLIKKVIGIYDGLHFGKKERRMSWDEITSAAKLIDANGGDMLREMEKIRELTSNFETETQRWMVQIQATNSVSDIQDFIVYVSEVKQTLINLSNNIIDTKTRYIEYCNNLIYKLSIHNKFDIIEILKSEKVKRVINTNKTNMVNNANSTLLSVGNIMSNVNIIEQSWINVLNNRK